MKKLKIALLSLLIMCFTGLRSNLVIWDIGGTLLTTDPAKAYWQIGPLNSIFYMLQFFSKNKLSMPAFKNHMKDLYLNTLTLIPSPCNNPDFGAKTIDGKTFPPLLRDYMLGDISGEQAMKVIFEWVEANPHLFKNSQQRTIFKETARLCFDPQINVKSQVYTKYLKTFKKCYEAKYKNGKRKNICIILSNWASDSLPILKANFSEIFDYSDVQIFSCNEKELKPSARLFRECLKHKSLKHKQAFFIDDQEENRLVAKKLGIICAHPKEAKAILKKHNVI